MVLLVTHVVLLVTHVVLLVTHVVLLVTCWLKLSHIPSHLVVNQ